MSDAPTFGADGVPAADDPYVVDPELRGAGDEPEDRGTVLSELEAELAAQVEITSCTLPVPGRPKYAVRYRTNLSGPENERCRKQATRRAGRGGREAEVDGTKFGALVCVLTCEEILRDAGDGRGFQPILDARGRPWRFSHQELMRVLGVSTASDAVRKFYGRDASLDAAANRVLVDSGWGSELEDLDLEDDLDLTPDPPAAGSAG